MEKVGLFVLGALLLFGGVQALTYKPSNLVENTVTVSERLNVATSTFTRLVNATNNFWSKSFDFIENPIQFLLDVITEAVRNGMKNILNPFKRWWNN